MNLESKIESMKRFAKTTLLAGSLAAFTIFGGCDAVDSNGQDNPATGCIVNNGGPASITYTSVPAIGSYDNIKGEVKNVDPSLHKVSLYIKVGSTWWMKPYWSRPLSSLNECGEFSIDYTTGGRDQTATSINAYLVTNDYVPKSHTLPVLSDEKVKAMISVNR